MGNKMSKIIFELKINIGKYSICFFNIGKKLNKEEFKKLIDGFEN